MDFDRDNPLNRIPGESRKANDALRDYYALGMERSMSKLQKKYKESGIKRGFDIIARWSSVFAWQARVDRQKQIDDKASDDKRRALIGEQIEKELQASIKMYEKGIALLTLPIIERKVTDQDGISYIVVPANAVELGAGRQLLREASQMARLALGMPTDTKNVDLTTSRKVTVIHVGLKQSDNGNAK